MTTRWHTVRTGSVELRASRKDGGAVLATILRTATMEYRWLLADGHNGVARTQYAAQRMVRREMKKEHNVSR